MTDSCSAYHAARVLANALLLALLAACSGPATPTTASDDHAPPKTNRIDVPEAVRQNLGITFGAVERRAVAATLRLSGSFELLPNGRRELRAPLAGRVEVHVQPLQQVQPGELLYTLDAPEWRRLQRELGDLEGELIVTEANLHAMGPLLEACEQHEASLRNALTTLESYVQNLEATQQQVGGQAQRLAEVRVQVAQTRAQVAEASEKHTQTELRITELRANLRAQQERRRLALAAAATSIGLPLAALDGPADGDRNWRALGVLHVHATAAGQVEQLPLASGSLVGAHALVLTTVDVTAVRFRARALQSDLGRLRDGLPAVLLPAGRAAAVSRVPAALQLGVSGEPLQRTLDVYAVPQEVVAFARPGVAGLLEIETATAGDRALAIPRSAVLQDGLLHVYFRRDPNDPDKVIRVEADLGLDDGRWVEIKSGLLEGEQVVVTGAYELVLASSGSAAKGGHFHADGTWHEDHE